MRKSCRRGYKLKNGKCKKESRKDIFINKTKNFRTQAINILFVSLIAVFSWLIFDGLSGLFNLKSLSNILKILVGIVAVIGIGYVARNKLRLKI